MDEGKMVSPIRGVCHRAFRARVFNMPVLFVLDSLSFRQRVLRSRSCVFTVREKEVSLLLMRILLDYNTRQYLLQDCCRWPP